jgi:hypothetical protein
MRFKTIFIIFNIVIIISFLFIFFMPLLLLGAGHFGEFVVKNWISGVLFLLALGGFNLYFIRNWRLFELLEKEDWHSLIDYLEDAVFQKGRINRRHIKILINSYLVTSNTDAIVSLGGFLSERRPEIVPSFAIPLGIPYLLSANGDESERFFGKLLSLKNLKERDWIRWDYAFSLLQGKQMDAARSRFTELASETSDPVLLLLSLYMLKPLARDDEQLETLIESRTQEFRKTHTVEAWNKRVEKAKDNMQILVLSKIIREASDWVFESSPTGESTN